MVTYANQKVVTIVKAESGRNNIYGIVNKECMFKAMNELKYNEFKVFMYLTANQDDYTMALSTQDIADKTGANKREIQKSIESLVEKKYIVPVKDNSNRFEFHEDKDNSEAKHEVLKNNTGYVEKQHSVCGKTTDRKSVV